MELIIWIIVIAVIVAKVNKQKKRTQQRQYHAQPNFKTFQQTPMNQNYQTVPNQQRSQNYQTVPNQQWSQNYQTVPNQQPSQGYQGAQNQGMQSQNMAELQAAMSSKQQELKARLQNRYGVQGAQQRPGAQKRPATQQRPVTQQKQVVQQYAAQQKQDAQQYVAQQRQDAQQDYVGENSFDTINNIGRSSVLMCQVNDLIVMGYQSNLTFERDFVAEGIELLNNYELGIEV